VVTKQQAISANYRHNFLHATFKDSKGNPMRCRVNGKCKTWVTRPNEFKLPMKYGLYQYFYITPDNANDWDIG
jgi:hypothetical protein